MENSKKTYVNLSWIIYIIIGVIGFFLVRLFFNELNISNVYDLNMNIYVYDALIILYGFVSCGLVYNLGKLIFSLICGYELVYFNLYFMGIEKMNGKKKLFFGLKHDLNCKVVMKPKKDNVNTTLPLLGGTIASIMAFGITYLLIFVLKTSATTKFFFLVSSMFYIFMVVLNLVPCRMDSINDGFSLFLLKDITLKNVYLTNLHNAHAMMDPSLEYKYQDIEINEHPFVLEAQIYNYYCLLNDKKIKEALNVISTIYEDRKNLISEEHSNTVLISYVYNLCVNKSNEELKELYSKLDINAKQIINSGKNLENIKTSLYIFTYIDEDKEGYVKIINDIDKVKAKYRYSRFVGVEEEMIKDVIKDVQENKPEWNE